MADRTDPGFVMEVGKDPLAVIAPAVILASLERHQLKGVGQEDVDGIRDRKKLIHSDHRPDKA